MQQQLQSELFREESRSARSMRKRKPSLFSSREHPPSRDIPEVPGMITRDEGAYYYFLASQVYSGSGALFELGTWLGRSTVCIAAGIRDSGLRGKVNAYDYFKFSGSNYARRISGLDYSVGDDFLADFIRFTRPLSTFIDANQTTLAELVWENSQPIEIAFLDMPKKKEDVRHVLRLLAPHLIAGESILVWHDYSHPPSRHIPLILSQLSDFLQPLHTVENGSTTSFKVVKPLTKADLSDDFLEF